MEERPWGSFTTIAEGQINTNSEKQYYKVKTLSINPLSRLSLQSHSLREEYWLIHSPCFITCGHNTLFCTSGSIIHIPISTKHRIENKQKTVISRITEISFSPQPIMEEDIIRYEDIYNRHLSQETKIPQVKKEESSSRRLF